MFLFVLWDVSPQIIDLMGLSVRWYGLLFATGFLVGQVILSHIFKQEGKPEKDVETVTVYMVVATILGARLGHTLFYEPDYYLSHPIEILKIWKGGLASHGATVGIITALYFYSRNRPGQSFLWILDRIVIVVALGGALIRMGNLMNSEIIGKPTNIPTAFIFANPVHEVLNINYGSMVEDMNISQTGRDTVVNGQKYPELAFDFTLDGKQADEAGAMLFSQKQLPFIIANYPEVQEYIKIFGNERMPQVQSTGNGTIQARAFAYGIPRHPSQLYEAISTLILCMALYLLWKKKKAATPEGSIFGLFVVILFSLRFAYEFLKENQVGFEDELPLNMGQLLSIPLVIAGIIVLVRAYSRNKPNQLNTNPER